MRNLLPPSWLFSNVYFQRIRREYLALKKEHDTVEGELRALRETFNLRQDTWIKEKLDMQVRNQKNIKKKNVLHPHLNLLT